MRWHESYGNYPNHLSDIDDYSTEKTDEFERVKALKPTDDKVVGSSDVILREDNDEKAVFYNIQGESYLSNPPNPNLITIDHGVDEEHIWNFPKSLYNQSQVTNQYSNGAIYDLH